MLDQKARLMPSLKKEIVKLSTNIGPLKEEREYRGLSLTDDVVETVDSEPTLKLPPIVIHNNNNHHFLGNGQMNNGDHG
jgi:hypothetical protein